MAGTYVNGKKVDMSEHPDGILLLNGDVITLGSCPSEFKFISRSEEASRVARQQADGDVSSAKLAQRQKFDQMASRYQQQRQASPPRGSYQASFADPNNFDTGNPFHESGGGLDIFNRATKLRQLEDDERLLA